MATDPRLYRHGIMKLNQEEVERLALQFATAVVIYQKGHERSRQTIFEVLNAIAINAAIVLAGVDGEARAWFNRAIDDNIELVNIGALETKIDGTPTDPTS